MLPTPDTKEPAGLAGGRIPVSAELKIEPERLIAHPLWYETSAFAHVQQIRMLAMFSNQDPLGRSIEFDGFTFQLWSLPSFVSPQTLPVVVHGEPEGWIGLGGHFTYDLTVDVSLLPSVDNRLAFRAVNRISGVVMPDRMALVSAEFFCA